MAAYNFKKRFAQLVESGEKYQTIRAERKDGWRPRIGTTLYLYTSMRTKSCQKLREAPCISVEAITIYKRVEVSGRWLTSGEVEKLAKADGFETVDQFFDFFRKEHGLPFRGLLIKWEPTP